MKLRPRTSRSLTSADVISAARSELRVITGAPCAVTCTVSVTPPNSSFTWPTGSVSPVTTTTSCELLGFEAGHAERQGVSARIQAIEDEIAPFVGSGLPRVARVHVHRLDGDAGHAESAGICHRTDQRTGRQLRPSRTRGQNYDEKSTSHNHTSASVYHPIEDFHSGFLATVDYKSYASRWNDFLPFLFIFSIPSDFGDPGRGQRLRVRKTRKSTRFTGDVQRPVLYEYAESICTRGTEHD